MHTALIPLVCSVCIEASEPIRSIQSIKHICPSIFSNYVYITSMLCLSQNIIKLLLLIQGFKFPRKLYGAKQYYTVSHKRLWQNFNYFLVNEVSRIFSFHVNLKNINFQKLETCDNNDFCILPEAKHGFYNEKD